MKYLILPGFSEKNKVWAYEVRDELEKVGVTSEVIEWDHWASGVEADFDFKREGEKVLKEVGNGDFGIIAKSIGSVLTSRLLKVFFERCARLVLLGIPLKSFTEKDKESFEIFKNFPSEKLLVFQNSQDPYGSYKEVREFMRSLNPKITVTMLLRDDHNYPINDILLNFVKEN